MAEINNIGKIKSGTLNVSCDNLSENIKFLKFINGCKIGITYNSRLLGDICLKGFSDIVNKFQIGSFILKKGDINKINIDDIKDYGKRVNKWKFDFSNCKLNTNYAIDIYLVGDNDKKSFIFNTGNNFSELQNNFSVNISNFRRYITIDKIDSSNNSIIIKTIDKNIVIGNISVSNAVDSELLYGLDGIKNIYNINGFIYAIGDFNGVYIYNDGWQQLYGINDIVNKIEYGIIGDDVVVYAMTSSDIYKLNNGHFTSIKCFSSGIKDIIFSGVYVYVLINNSSDLYYYDNNNDEHILSFTDIITNIFASIEDGRIYVVSNNNLYKVYNLVSEYISGNIGNIEKVYDYYNSITDTVEIFIVNDSNNVYIYIENEGIYLYTFHDTSLLKDIYIINSEAYILIGNNLVNLHNGMVLRYNIIEDINDIKNFDDDVYFITDNKIYKSGVDDIKILLENDKKIYNFYKFGYDYYYLDDDGVHILVNDIININVSEVQGPIKYKNGRVKFVFVMCSYDEYNKDIDSNKLSIDFCYDDDYVNGYYNWRKMGKLFINSGCDDITDSDMNLVETIWVKNNNDNDVNINYLVAI